MVNVKVLTLSAGVLALLDPAVAVSGGGAVSDRVSDGVSDRVSGAVSERDSSRVSDELCVSPGVCSPPPSLHSRGRDAVPRYQWTSSGGFCGSSSIQTILQSFGVYLSQDVIRKAAPVAAGHGNAIEGYEILHTNIEATLDTLGVSYNSWDWAGQPQPQGVSYLSWLKSQLARDGGVVQFILCKGDAHQAYAPENIYDHIEPFFRLYTNHEVNDTAIYEDDYVAHGSGYSPDGEENLGYFRPLNSLLDGLEMDGNCAAAQEGWKKNEMYPCLYDQQTFGYSLTGLTCGQSVDQEQGPNFPVTLYVNNTVEPNIREGEDAVSLQGRVVVSGLKTGSTYFLYRWDGVDTFPNVASTPAGCGHSREAVMKLYENSEYSHKTKFVAQGDVYDFVDTALFLSSGSARYSCVGVGAEF